MKIELMSKDEWYDVEFEGTNYTLQYHEDCNIGWRNIEVLDEDGNEVSDEIRDKIAEQFNSKEVNSK